MRRTKNIGAYLALAAVALLTTAPFLWIILTAFKGSEDIFRYPPVLLPDQWTLKNFIMVWEVVPFGRYLVNSLIVSAIIVALNLLLCSLAAYPLARMEFRGKKLLFLLIISTIMIPEQVVMIPVYEVLLHAGLLNTLAGIILPVSVSAFGIFYMRQVYLGLPRDLEDAAVIDGCSPLRVWWSVLVPLSAPALATLAVFTFVGSWSSFLFPLVVLRDAETFTLPVGLSQLISSFSANYKVLAAGSVLATLPVLLFYLLLQRFFIRGILSGSIKG